MGAGAVAAVISAERFAAAAQMACCNAAEASGRRLRLAALAREVWTSTPEMAGATRRSVGRIGSECGAPRRASGTVYYVIKQSSLSTALQL